MNIKYGTYDILQIQENVSVFFTYLKNKFIYSSNKCIYHDSINNYSFVNKSILKKFLQNNSIDKYSTIKLFIDFFKLINFSNLFPNLQYKFNILIYIIIFNIYIIIFNINKQYII